MDPPQVVVGEFCRSWTFETGHIDAGGIHSSEEIPDRSILAAGIHGLENDHESSSAFGVKSLLQIAQSGAQLFRSRDSLVFGDGAPLGICWDAIEPDFLPGFTDDCLGLHDLQTSRKVGPVWRIEVSEIGFAKR